MQHPKPLPILLPSNLLCFAKTTARTMPSARELGGEERILHLEKGALCLPPALLQPCLHLTAGRCRLQVPAPSLVPALKHPPHRVLTPTRCSSLASYLRSRGTTQIQESIVALCIFEPNMRQCLRSLSRSKSSCSDVFNRRSLTCIAGHRSPSRRCSTRAFGLFSVLVPSATSIACTYFSRSFSAAC
jgi:hypothetical protein